MQDDKLKFSISLLRSDLVAIDEYAAAHDLSRSRVIRQAIRDFLSRIMNRTTTTPEPTDEEAA